MKNPIPRSRAYMTTTPGSRGGLATPQGPIKSGPTVQQSFVKGKKMGAKKMTSPSYAKKTSNPRVAARGKAKIAQGGESESASGLSRTNKGRQRL